MAGPLLSPRPVWGPVPGGTSGGGRGVPRDGDGGVHRGLDSGPLRQKDFSSREGPSAQREGPSEGGRCQAKLGPGEELQAGSPMQGDHGGHQP